MTVNETLTSIRTNAQFCWTCGGAPNPENFGGLCDSCNSARRTHLRESVRVLEDCGRTETQEYRALKVLRY